jgi:outer membrane protein OmpA-like peptidoglycan-associated protein
MDLRVLENARQSVGNCGSRRAFLAGHADTNEDPDLAEKRVEVVRAWLEANGVPRADIVTRAFGAEVPRIATVEGVSEPQNRRVEITFGR